MIRFLINGMSERDRQLLINAMKSAVSSVDCTGETRCYDCHKRRVCVDLHEALAYLENKETRK